VAKIPRSAQRNQQWRSLARGSVRLGPTARRLGRRIARLRIESAVTQEWLAERCGISTRHLQDIEAGRVNVTLAIELAIARALGVTLSELFEGV
jgi:DNA-binding XRE family transcriptional regulator